MKTDLTLPTEDQLGEMREYAGKAVKRMLAKRQDTLRKYHTDLPRNIKKRRRRK